MSAQTRDLVRLGVHPGHDDVTLALQVSAQARVRCAVQLLRQVLVLTAGAQRSFFFVFVLLYFCKSLAHT